MKKFTLPVFLLLLLLIGCAEKPKSVGNGLPNIDGVFNITDTTFYAVNETSYVVTFAKGSGLSNLAGRISPTEEAVSLINFLPDATIDSLKGARIDTVEFRVTVNYKYRSTTYPVVFNIVEVQRSWSQSSFTSDSLSSLTLGSKVIGTFSDSMNYTVTSIARLDTVEVRKWANSYIDTTAADFYGFAIQAPSGVTNGIVGFSTFDSYTGYAPQIFIRYTKNGIRDSLTYYSGEDTYATKYTGPTTFSPIVVRGGFGFRSKIRFDISSLVDKPIVNNAALELTLDTSASSFGGYSPDTVTALMAMSNTILDQSDSTIFVYGFRTTTVAGQPPVYSFKLTAIADRWVRSVKPNYGITLRWAAEYGTVEKAVFYSSANTDVTKRPKLKITYAKK
jgi:hypothetical protein